MTLPEMHQTSLTSFASLQDLRRSPVRVLAFAICGRIEIRRVKSKAGSLGAGFVYTTQPTPLFINEHGLWPLLI